MKKTLLTIVLTVLVCCTVLGSTYALLMQKTGTIENTFTAGDINIELTESDNLNLKMIPGSELMKDPTVTVKEGSEACYVFIQIVEDSTFDTFMTYELAEGWEAVTGYTNLYYRTVGTVGTTLGADTKIPVLKDDKVVVKRDITKEQLKNATPKLSFLAMAVQLENVENVTDALAAIQNYITPNP